MDYKVNSSLRELSSRRQKEPWEEALFTHPEVKFSAQLSTIRYVIHQPCALRYVVHFSLVDLGLLCTLLTILHCGGAHPWWDEGQDEDGEKRTHFETRTHQSLFSNFLLNSGKHKYMTSTSLLCFWAHVLQIYNMQPPYLNIRTTFAHVPPPPREDVI